MHLPSHLSRCLAQQMSSCSSSKLPLLSTHTVAWVHTHLGIRRPSSGYTCSYSGLRLLLLLPGLRPWLSTSTLQAMTLSLSPLIQSLPSGQIWFLQCQASPGFSSIFAVHGRAQALLVLLPCHLLRFSAKKLCFRTKPRLTKLSGSPSTSLPNWSTKSLRRSRSSFWT